MNGPVERARHRGGRTPLPAIAAAATALGLAASLAVAANAVGNARDRATGNDARMAAALWELPGAGAQAVAQFLGNRVAIQAAEAGGRGPGEYGYEAGALDPVVWIAIDPEPASPSWPAGATVLALLAVLLMAAWATRRRHHPPPPRYPATTSILTAALLALVAVAAARWADLELEDLSAAHVSHALDAASIASATGATPATAARVAGLPWATATALDRPDQLWTMPREVARAIAALPPDLRAAGAYTIQTSGATYHGAHANLPTPAGAAPPPTTLHLAFLGYQETAAPTIPLAATTTATILALNLILFLLPLSARPRTLRRTLAAWSFLAPAATLLLLFTFGPLLFSLWISLHEWHLVDPAHPFTGLDNYRDILLDATWWSAIRNTAVFTLHVPAAMAVALALALLTQGSRRAIRWARLALFLPGITSVVAIAVVWKWLLNDGYGVVNQTLARAGVGPVAWLTSPDTALASLMLISVWMVVGYQMVVFQAGLAAIPRDWYDAARVDGAGPLQRFRHITLPGLRHTLFFVLVTSVIGSFQVFGLVYVMTEGGPLGATDVAVYHIYREAWEFLRFGNAAAMSWILFAVVFAATWLHFRFLESRRDERRAYA